MPDRWEFHEADALERALLTSRAAILQLPRVPAAPPNRARRVWRVEHLGRTWYLKEFGPTSLANRWRFWRTRPRAVDDAQREQLVTEQLRQGGFVAPRPVASGRDALGSCYVCAPLPGESLRQRLQTGSVPRHMARAIATFCGEVLRSGYWLPDLSAEHVFVRRDDSRPGCGLLDLHNGARMPAGPPPRWLCRRVLRHFARSVHDLAIPRGAAMRFAARLLASAGRGADTRALLRRVPVLDTAWRYEQHGKARDYGDRNPARASRELGLLARVWPGRAGETILDVPCGAGRLLPFLEERGHHTIWADGALAMVQEARRRQRRATPAVQAHALALPFGDRSVDGVVQFRFLHHLPRAAAKTAVAEACRVARRFVVLSFFHPCSSHHLQRRCKELLLRRAATRFALTLGRLDRWCQSHGLRRVAVAADGRYRKDLWVAAFERTQQ